MPRTNTDAIRELELLTAAHDIAIKGIGEDALLAQTTDRALAVQQKRVENIRSEVVRVEKRLDELDRKLWTITCLLIAALLSLVASLLVQIVRK